MVWLEMNPSSPLTRNTLTKGQLIPNRGLKVAIDTWRLEKEKSRANVVFEDGLRPLPLQQRREKQEEKKKNIFSAFSTFWSQPQTLKMIRRECRRSARIPRSPKSCVATSTTVGAIEIVALSFTKSWIVVTVSTARRELVCIAILELPTAH